VARKEYVQEHPDVAKAFVDANLEALKWVNSHSPKDVAAVLPEKLKATAGVENILADVIPSVSANGITSAPAVALTINLMKDIGELPKDSKVSPKQIIDSRFLE
jgi:ABC-type nitrate/sulfonate/bicarbonate transport system substrate-binding protein